MAFIVNLNPWFSAPSGQEYRRSHGRFFLHMHVRTCWSGKEFSGNGPHETARYIRRHRFFGDFFSSACRSLALGSGPPANARARAGRWFLDLDKVACPPSIGCSFRLSVAENASLRDCWLGICIGSVWTECTRDINVPSIYVDVNTHRLWWIMIHIPSVPNYLSLLVSVPQVWLDW